MVRRIGYLIFFLLISAVAVSAAEKEEPTREFSFFIAGDRPDEKVYYGEFDDGELVGSVSLKFRTSGRSDRYEYDGPNPIYFFTETPRPTQEDPDAVERNVIAVANVEPETEEIMFLFLKEAANTNEDLPYSVTAIDIDSRSLPRGHLKIVSMAPVELQGIVGSGSPTSLDEKTTFRVRPGINPPLRLSSYSKVIIALETERAGWVKAFEDEFSIRRDEKYLLLVYPPKVRGSIILRGSVIAFRDRGVESLQPEGNAP